MRRLTHTHAHTHTTFQSALVMHNLNMIMVCAELFFAKTPVLFAHAPLAPLFGVTYLSFSWWWAHQVQPKDGPHYFYDFMDPTLTDKETCVNTVGLLIVLLTFYCFTSIVSAILMMNFWSNSETATGFLLAAVFFFVSKFRD